jgi:hypothetical protein
LRMNSKYRRIRSIIYKKGGPKLLEVFVGIAGFAIGVVVGATALGYFAIKSALRRNAAAADGVKRGLADLRDAAANRRRDAKDMGMAPPVTKITTYRCLRETCGKTFTTVGPLLSDPKCLHCGYAAEPATKKSRSEAARSREAEAFETNPFGEEVRN